MVRINWNAALQALRWKRIGRRLLISLAIAGTAIAAPGLAGLLFLNHLVNGPLPETATDTENVSIVLHDSAGEEIGIRGKHKRPVEFSKLPDHTVAAFLAIEDRRFFRHRGVDLVGVGRALLANYRAREIVEGGSTITQQLAKNIYLGPERTWQRKLDEAILALRLEKQLSKENILETYLYTIYFGNNAYGIEAAAEAYFRKPAAALTIAESALLAGSIKAPGTHAPHIDPDYAKARAHLVLDAMADTGSISLLDAALAAYDVEKLSVHLREPGPRGHFLDFVVSALQPDTTTDEIVHAHTTLNSQFQVIAENALATVMTDKVMTEKNVTEAAIVAMRPGGEIVAMIGGRDYAHSEFNRATQAYRQPGSLFKTFVYDAAFRQGWRLDDLIIDAELTIETPQGKDDLYIPANYNDRYYGLVSTQHAFAKSANSSALRLQEWAGRETVISAAKRSGLDASLKPFPSLGLGVNETTLLDLTAAYASLAAGKIVEPYAIKNMQPGASALPGQISPELLQLLYYNVQAGTGYAAEIGRPAFGKTGTTQDHRDAWFVGFTDHLVVGVWVGNDDNSPTRGVTGGRLPARIWHRFMTDATKIIEQESQPPRFASRSLLEIALSADEDINPFGWDVAETRRILGPGTYRFDGSIDMGGARIELADIRPVSGYGTYHAIYEEVERYFTGRELVCEVSRYFTSCFDGETNVAEKLVENGWARTTYSAPRYLRQAEQRARQEHKGIWAKRYRYAHSYYDYYDSRDLTRRQRKQLEKMRAREEERLRKLQEHYQRQRHDPVVIGRSAVGQDPTGGRIIRPATGSSMPRVVTGSVASKPGR